MCDPVCLWCALSMHVYVCTLHSESMRLYLRLFICRLVDGDLEAILGTFGEILPPICDVTSPKCTRGGRPEEGLWFGVRRWLLGSQIPKKIRFTHTLQPNYSLAVVFSLGVCVCWHEQPIKTQDDATLQMDSGVRNVLRLPKGHGCYKRQV